MANGQHGDGRTPQGARPTNDDNEDDALNDALDAVDDQSTDDEFDPGEYDAMLRLEQLESLEEEMRELGVTTLDEVRARIAALHRQLDQQGD